MQGTIIDLFASEAYIAMPDGLNICVSLARLPSNIKVGSKISLSATAMQMTNHNLINKIL